jgi:pheromone shutdown protein TraB
MITLLGVGHVFNIATNVERLITERMPTAVCVELDRIRYMALRRRYAGKQEPLIKDAPLVYQLLGKFQERMAAKYETAVGEEMLAAIATAKKIGAELAFIDMDASQVFGKIWASMKFSERLKLVLGAITGLFIRRERVERELREFEAHTEEFMEKFGTEFPTFKRVLVDERDQYMANAIRELSKIHARIVAVIGDGHIDGVRKALEGLEVEVIRLSKVRAPVPDEKPTEKNKPNINRSVTISYTYQ